MTTEEFNVKYDVHSNTERMCYTCAYCKRIRKKEEGEEKFVCLAMKECRIDNNEVSDTWECSNYEGNSVDIPFDLDKYDDYKSKYKATAKFDLKKYAELHKDDKEVDKSTEDCDDITVEELIEWRRIKHKEMFDNLFNQN